MQITVLRNIIRPINPNRKRGVTSVPATQQSMSTHSSISIERRSSPRGRSQRDSSGPLLGRSDHCLATHLSRRMSRVRTALSRYLSFVRDPGRRTSHAWPVVLMNTAVPHPRATGGACGLQRLAIAITGKPCWHSKVAGDAVRQGQVDETRRLHFRGRFRWLRDGERAVLVMVRVVLSAVAVIKSSDEPESRSQPGHRRCGSHCIGQSPRRAFDYAPMSRGEHGAIAPAGARGAGGNAVMSVTGAA